MTVMCILMILWWNAVLSVFHMPFDHRWLYGGTCAVIFLLGWSDRKFRWKASAAGLAVAALILWFYRDTFFRLYEWMAQNASSVLSGQPEGKGVPHANVIGLARKTSTSENFSSGSNGICKSGAPEKKCSARKLAEPV